MDTMNPQTRRFLIGFRVLVAVCLFLTTGFAGWGGPALAAGADDRDRFAGLIIESAVLPPWFTPAGAPNPASAAPPLAQNPGPLAAPVIQSVEHSSPTNEGSPITFTVTASDTVYYGFDWDSDGSYEIITQTGESAANTWNDDGTYTITVRADDDAGGVVTDTDTVTVNNLPPSIASLSNSGPVDEGLAASITVTATDPGSDTLTYAYDWNEDDDFDDDGEDNNTYTWNNDGVHTITVRVSDGDGGVVTDTTTITVNDTDPVADFTATPGSGDEPLTVTFSDTSVSHDGIVTWTWNFGDNSSSSAQNPVHQYNQDDVYTVTLTVEEADSDSDTETKISYITVNDTGPTANFHADLFSGSEPLTVTFSDDSTAHDGLLAWNWDFGDSSPNSTDQNPVHQYAQNGVYAVTLTVYDTDGDPDTETKTAYITVNDTGPDADFHADTTSGDEPLTVTFSDDSTAYDGVTGWSWDLGDGSPVSTEQTPTHQYAQDGVYTVTLTAQDADGSSDIETKTAYITVSDTAPTADFTAVPASGDESLTVNFADTSTAYDGVSSLAWDLDGDGATDSTDPNPVFTYTAAGVYTVTLTAWDADGSSDTVTKTDCVTVNNVPPTAVIKGPFTRTAGPVVLDASDSTEPGGDISAYEWDLDDDGQYDDDTGITVTVSLTAVGVYTVGLRVTDAESSTGTDRVAITIEPAPLDHFVVSLPVSSTAGVAFGTVITAEDEYGNVITDWNQTVTLTTNGGAISPPEALGSEFVGGVWSKPVSLTTAGDGRLVRASHSGHTGQDTLHIEPAAATDFGFSAIGQQTAGDSSPPFSLIAYDTYGNQDTNYTGNHTLNWSGLITSPGGTGPVYPSPTTNFVSGQAYNLHFTAYGADTNVTLTASESGGPGGVSAAFTVTHAVADEFVFSNIADQVAGSSGTFTLTAQDDFGNTATGYTGPHSLTWDGLGNSLNGDSPAYPADPVSFSGGVASLLAFTPYRAEANVRITATEGSVSGLSNVFDVNVGSVVGEIVIESATGGTGSEVDTHDMVIYDSFTVHAAGYDAWGNYIADQSVNWGGTVEALGSLIPAIGSSTTFTPVVRGSGIITAHYSATITDATGLITVRAPVLEVALSDSIEPVEAGAALIYTITYSNTGNADATNTALTLTLDSNVTYVSDSGSSSGSDHVRTWNLNTVGTGASEQVIVTVTVESPLNNGTILESVAGLDSDLTDVVTDSEETTVSSQPVLHITKSGPQSPVPAGEVIIYTINFSNTGNMIATGVVVTDVIPANTQFHTASSPYSRDGDVITWNVGTLAVDDPETRFLSVRVDDPLPSGTVITNADYQIDGNQTAPVSGPPVTTAVLSPTLTLSQSSDPNLEVSAGQLVTFTLSFSNTGSGDASSVVITDNLPANTVFVSASGSHTYSGDTVVWNIGTLGKHEGGQRELVLRVTSPLTNGTAIINEAVIDSEQTTPTTSSNLVYVVSEPVLHLSKVDASDPVPAGAQLLYTISFTNTGNANATGLVITDALPMHTTFVSASDGGTYDDGVVTWNLPPLSGQDLAGQAGVGSVTLTVTVESPLANGTLLENVASIACAEGSHDQAEEQTTVESLPHLVIDVSDNPDPVKGNQTLVYTVSYANTGNADATGVQLTAEYDARLTFVAADPAPSSGNNIWNNLPLLPGEGGSGTVVITLTTAALSPEAELNSTFRLRSTEAGWVSHSEKTSAEAVDLALTVSYDDDTPYPGKWITYSLHYANNGDIAATGVELKARSLAGIVYGGGAGWSAVGDEYHYSLGTVNAGADGSVEFIVQVDSIDNGERLPAVSSLEASFGLADDGGNGPELYTSDNAADSLVGIPDLIVEQIEVSPSPPTPDRPMTVTVRIYNQGTGMAWDPNEHRNFFVDLFIDPDTVPRSYPWNGYADIFTETTPLAPGHSREIVFKLPAGLSEGHHEVYAKVDNWWEPGSELWQRNSFVPESDEENNLFHLSLDTGPPAESKLFLPAVLKNH